MLLQAVKSMFSPASQKLLDLDAPQFTPDWWRLSTYQFQNVFVYNQFMRGCQGYSIMEGNSIKRSSAFTVDQDFVLWKKDLGLKTQAFALRIPESEMFGAGHYKSSLLGTPAKILGHIYLVAPNQIVKLDTELQNGVMYDRERITVQVPYARKTGRYLSDIEIATVPVWAYIARLDYWSELLNPSDKRCGLVRSYRKNADTEPYYFYSEANEQARRK